MKVNAIQSHLYYCQKAKSISSNRIIDEKILSVAQSSLDILQRQQENQKLSMLLLRALVFKQFLKNCAALSRLQKRLLSLLLILETLSAGLPIDDLIEILIELDQEKTSEESFLPKKLKLRDFFVSKRIG